MKMSNYDVDIQIDARDVLCELSLTQVLNYFEVSDALDAIGIEEAKEHWGLKE